ncbi:MAG: alcohol dehydrogenase catalytic domain-containing protein [Novosphingobium sp.]
MRAAIYNGGVRPITVENLPEPVAAPDQLLIEIAYCGVCGSDVSMTAGGPFDYPKGHCFGHEFAGTILELGREVTGFRRGDRVACMPNSGCGRCEACREGRLLLCAKGRPSFGFAERTTVAAAYAVRLPDSLSIADGALIEPMACGLRALRGAGMRGGERVLVLGAGSMALSVVWWARALGAGRVVVASRSARARDLCIAFGADCVHSFDEDDPGELAAALGGAPHIVAECVGKPGLLNRALDLVHMGGTVIAMGMCMTPEPILPIARTFKEARIIFPLGYSPAEFAEAARAFDSARFCPETMVSDVLPLDKLGGALNALRAGEKMQKVHIDPRPR